MMHTTGYAPANSLLGDRYVLYKQTASGSAWKEVSNVCIIQMCRKSTTAFATKPINITVPLKTCFFISFKYCGTEHDYSTIPVHLLYQTSGRWCHNDSPLCSFYVLRCMSTQFQLVWSTNFTYRDISAAKKNNRKNKFLILHTEEDRVILFEVSALLINHYSVLAYIFCIFF